MAKQAVTKRAARKLNGDGVRTILAMDACGVNPISMVQSIIKFFTQNSWAVFAIMPAYFSPLFA